MGDRLEALGKVDAVAEEGDLAAAAAGLAFQPLSQALQEFPEMKRLHDEVHRRIAPGGGTVQMLARIGYCADVIPPSPRWPLSSFARTA